MRKLSSFLLAALLFVSTLLAVVPSASAAGWQDYVDIQLIGTGKVSQAAIISADGSSVWAHSEGFEPSASETKAVADLYKDLASAQATGFRLNGLKYFTVQANGRSIYGKSGSSGAIIVKTKQAILIGTSDGEKISSLDTTPVVEGLADYLISVQY